MSDDLIRVILADDHAVVRAGLKAVLGASSNIQVVGEAADGSEAVALAERLDPDVVIMDLSMDRTDGAAATRQIVDKKLRARVLILTMHAEEDYLILALEAGAAGYLMKNAADRELVDAVRTRRSRRHVHSAERGENPRTGNRQEGSVGRGARAFRAPD